MSQPVATYDGDYITCYPGSNQKDDGKLQLEYNMARIVTRLSSKNFCIVNPSYEIESSYDPDSGDPKLKIGTGQCSINGMDLIMTTTLLIDPPESEGTYYLAFKLARDSSNNVLGDLIYGVTTTFQGVYLTYFDEKPDPQTDMDMLYLGKVIWDGSSFTDIEEDEDKYGRIWAEDILTKIEDPKHPDISRLNLQELIYNLPDWYFSKEGDTIYGPLIIADNRDGQNPGIIMSVDKDGSHITIKDPEVDNDKLIYYGDVNQDGKIDSEDIELVQSFINGTATPTAIQKELCDLNHDNYITEEDLQYIQNYIDGVEGTGDVGNIYYISENNNIVINAGDDSKDVQIGTTYITSDKNNDFSVNNEEGDILVEAEAGNIDIIGKDYVNLETSDEGSAYIKVENDDVLIGNKESSLGVNVSWPSTTNVQLSIGKALWQYDSTTSYIKLLSSNVKALDIAPNQINEQNLYNGGNIYIGTKDNSSKTYLQRYNWRITDSDSSDYIDITPELINIINPGLSSSDNSILCLRNSGDTIHTKIYDDAKIELLNPTRQATIDFKDGNTSYDISIKKIIGEKKLNISGDLTLVNLTASGTVTGAGLKTTNGVITFSRGTNDATITKDNNASALRTSGNLYVGSSGTSNLYAGATTLKGQVTIGSSGQMTIDTSGNLSVGGTKIIDATNKKVYMAVYNDIVEFMEKEDYEEEINEGDVVFFTDSGKVTKYHQGINLNAKAGIVSSESTYGAALGGEGLEDNQKVPVALAGRVYVNVDETYVNNLRAGDLLTISNLGYIVKQLDNNITLQTIGMVTKSEIENNKVLVKVI